MGKLIYLGLFMFSLDPTYEPASNTARRALLETPMMKSELKIAEGDAERHLYESTRLTRQDFMYAAYAYPLFAGRVSTKPFKQFKYETKSKWTMRPEMEYKFNGQYSGFLFLTKEW